MKNILLIIAASLTLIAADSPNKENKPFQFGKATEAVATIYKWEPHNAEGGEFLFPEGETVIQIGAGAHAITATFNRKESKPEATVIKTKLLPIVTNTGEGYTITFSATPDDSPKGMPRRGSR